MPVTLSPVPAPGPHPPGADFGDRFLRLVLHKQRVLESIDRVLGDRLELGPIGAGPGRRLARITVRCRFQPSYGEELDEPDVLGFQVFVPVSVTFDLDLRVDTMSFDADLVLPLVVRMYVEDPLTIVWDITPPGEGDLVITVKTDQRRAAVLQRLTGLDGELRRFILRFIARELDKPHVRKATRIRLVEVIDGAWPVLAAQFLPNSPKDRQLSSPVADPEPGQESGPESDGH